LDLNLKSDTRRIIFLHSHCNQRCRRRSLKQCC